MGYTHYWRKVGPWPEDKLKAAVADMQTIIKRCDIPLANYAGESGTMPEMGELLISFNGVGTESYETFLFPPSTEDEKFAFCKTGRRPYDQVVVACLLAAKHHLGDAIRVSSDGRWEREWLQGAWTGAGSGVAMYEHIFPDRNPVKNPLLERR